MNKATSLRARLGVHMLQFALLSGTMLSSPAVAQDALPTGGQVVAGSATIETSGPTMTVNQSSDRVITNWQSFSIGPDNTVTFNQPSANSVALNRVIGQDPSQILGRLTANGQVFLVNPNGIVIGKGGSVQSGGFVGSTLDISNTDFLSGNYRFTGTGSAIVNQGDLKGGVVALIAPRVSNQGTITGDTALAAGTDATLDFDGDGLISVEVKGSTLATLVENKGLIQADGGVAILTARGASDAMRGVVNNTGTIEASGIAAKDGRILLLGDMDHGEVNAGGTLQAGLVETSARTVNIADGIQVKTGGGQWLIDPNDFTIAASGGNITGTTLSNNLQNGNVTISTATQGTAGGNGDIHVNDAVTWSANTLTLHADRNININTAMNGSGTAGLALEYAQGDASGEYFVNAPVNLASTGSFSTKKGSASAINYTIITSLGSEASSNDGSLQGIRGNLTGNYVLGTNIDATATSSWNSGAGFSPIGTSAPYVGNFSGLGHEIKNLYINLPLASGVGLFGNLSNSYANTELRDLLVTNASITGSSDVGIVAGVANDVRIMNVRVSGSVTASTAGSVSNPFAGDRAGGLVGQLRSQGEVLLSSSQATVSGRDFAGGLIGDAAGPVSRSSASGNVLGRDNVGGLIGLSQGDLNNIYATGNSQGRYYVGGLAGSNYGRISNSYATGAIVGNIKGGLVGNNTNANNLGLVSGSFWDTQSTGQSAACGDNSGTCTATGLTTAQMKDPATFTAAGWDFTSIWGSDPAINSGYPYLRATVASTVTPPPTPPPPPPTALTVSNIANLTTSTAPYQPTISLTGTGFASVTEVRFTWTDPNGQTGTVTWNAANNFGGGRFVPSADGNSATIAPTLVASGDPSGTYQWSVTFVAGTQSITKSFTVAYSGVVTPPPPPPPPPVALSLTSNISDLTYASATPWRLQIPITGQGLNGVTSIVLSWVDPAGRRGSATWNSANGFGAGNYAPSASGTSATLTPTLLAAGDPPGLYQWTITFTNGTQTATDRFNVNYTAPSQGQPVVYGPVQPSTSDVIWGVQTGNSTPGLIDMTTAGSTTPFSPIVALNTLRSDANLGGGIDLWNRDLSAADAAPALLTYALLAEDAYRDGGPVPNLAGWTPMMSWEDVLHKGLISAGNADENQIELAISKIRASGFNARVYSRDGKYVLAFEGTNVWSLADWSTDLKQAIFGETSGNQYEFALLIANMTADQFGSSLVLTGHSLGGGLAQYVASQRSNMSAITFNAAGINGDISSSLSNVINVRVTTDPVSSGVFTNQLGEKSFVYPQTSINPYQHPIGSVINSLLSSIYGR